MRIKKIFQGSIPENKILNEESTSQTDTYSCAKINEMTKGTVLYENEEGLEEGNVTLTTTASDCRYVDIVYSLYKTFFSKRVYKREFSSFVLDGMMFSNSSTSYNFSSNYSIDDTNLIFNQTKSGTFLRNFSNGSFSGYSSYSDVKIHEVIGYK